MRVGGVAHRRAPLGHQRRLREHGIAGESADNGRHSGQASAGEPTTGGPGLSALDQMLILAGHDFEHPFATPLAAQHRHRH